VAGTSEVRRRRWAGEGRRGGLGLVGATASAATAPATTPAAALSAVSARSVARAAVPRGSVVAVLTGASTLLDRLGVDQQASAMAVLAGLAEGLDQPGADLLAGHLHQAEGGDLGDLVAGAVAA
jgi:hypothetical protein